MISVITWIIAIAAWLVILLAPVALVALAAVPPWRRWWLRPLLRRVTGRTAFHRAFTESLKEAATEEKVPLVFVTPPLPGGEYAAPRYLHLEDVSRACGEDLRST